MIYPLYQVNDHLALLDKRRLSRVTANIPLHELKAYVQGALTELGRLPLHYGYMGDYQVQRELVDVLSYLEFDKTAFLDVKELMPYSIVIKEVFNHPKEKERTALYVISYSEYESQLRMLMKPFFTYHQTNVYRGQHVNFDDVIEAVMDYVVSQVYASPVRIWPVLQMHLTRALENKDSRLGQTLDRLEALFWFGKESENYRLHTIDVRKSIVNLVMRKE